MEGRELLEIIHWLQSGCSMSDHLFAVILTAGFCIIEILKAKYLLKKKKNQGNARGECPHSPGKQLSILTPGLEANLHTC